MPDPDNPAVCSYQELFECVRGWIQSGQFTFNGNVRVSHHCQLDDYLLKLFGFPHMPNRIADTKFHVDTETLAGIRAFDKAVRAGELNIDWILGPHGLTLFKAKIARMESK